MQSTAKPVFVSFPALCRGPYHETLKTLIVSLFLRHGNHRYHAATLGSIMANTRQEGSHACCPRGHGGLDAGLERGIIGHVTISANEVSAVHGHGFRIRRSGSGRFSRAGYTWESRSAGRPATVVARRWLRPGQTRTVTIYEAVAWRYITLLAIS